MNTALYAALIFMEVGSQANGAAFFDPTTTSAQLMQTEDYKNMRVGSWKKYVRTYKVAKTKGENW